MVITKVLTQLTAYERHDTATSHNTSVALKLLIVKFIDSTLIPLSVNRDPSKWYENNGLITDAYSVLFSMSIIDAVVKWIDFGHQFRKIRRRYSLIGKFACIEIGKSLNQKEANE
jgi:hypothetical protein